MDTTTTPTSSTPTHPGTLLGVWAHPDDETYLAGGLMARAARAGWRVVSATATLGERGGPDGDVAVAATAELRRRELTAALARLGVYEVRVLGLPDGGCADVEPALGTSLVAAVMAEVEPDLVVTFGPDGFTGHPDHVAVSRWTTTAWRAGGHGTLLYAAATRRFATRFADVHARFPVFAGGEPVVCDDREIAVAVELDGAELDRKREALRAHASQTEALAAAMGERTYRHWLDVESFRRPRLAELTASRLAHGHADATRQAVLA